MDEYEKVKSLVSERPAVKMGLSPKYLSITNLMT